MKTWKPISIFAATVAVIAVAQLGEEKDELVKERKLVLNKITKAVEAIDAAPTAAQYEVKFYESDVKAAWHLVHDGEKVLAFIEGPGVTWTTNNLIAGTREECEKVIDDLKLEPLPIQEPPEIP